MLKGRLPSKLLSAQERLAIQSGSMLRVAITGQDKNGYIASLPGRSSSVIESRNDFGRPQQAGGRRYDNNNKPKPVLPTTPPGPLMNNLKTGMKFEGTVKHVTPYAAFVDANIFRRAKGGVFAPVNGLLSKHDMSEDVINRDQDSNSRQRKAFALEKGSKVAVYVKEVYKNAG